MICFTRKTYRDIPKPTPDFFAELEHLLKGLMGKSGIYPEKVPGLPCTKVKGPPD
jgi:hypothetical protein